MVKIKDTMGILRLRLVRGLCQGIDVDAPLLFRLVLVREGFDVRVRCCLVQCLCVRDLKCVSVCVCVYCWYMGGAYLKRVLIA